ncbi:unnamed protein product [Protopolystoma xenopodis]|uniref:Uncharacterized protein n=1 Tax=Protopolystoma xenopodis TaxID=117903 RepID=A0A3S4ZF19_9PLAT|nr:unnamed protein product [Protopolystoma xenopodis]
MRLVSCALRDLHVSLGFELVNPTDGHPAITPSLNSLKNSIQSKPFLPIPEPGEMKNQYLSSWGKLPATSSTDLALSLVSKCLQMTTAWSRIGVNGSSACTDGDADTTQIAQRSTSLSHHRPMKLALRADNGHESVFTMLKKYIEDMGISECPSMSTSVLIPKSPSSEPCLQENANIEEGNYVKQRNEDICGMSQSGSPLPRLPHPSVSEPSSDGSFLRQAIPESFLLDSTNRNMASKVVTEKSLSLVSPTNSSSSRLDFYQQKLLSSRESVDISNSITQLAGALQSNLVDKTSLDSKLILTDDPFFRLNTYETLYPNTQLSTTTALQDFASFTEANAASISTTASVSFPTYPSYHHTSTPSCSSLTSSGSTSQILGLSNQYLSSDKLRGSPDTTPMQELSLPEAASVGDITKCAVKKKIIIRPNNRLIRLKPCEADISGDQQLDVILGFGQSSEMNKNTLTNRLQYSSCNTAGLQCSTISDCRSPIEFPTSYKSPCGVTSQKFSRLAEPLSPKSSAAENDDDTDFLIQLLLHRGSLSCLDTPDLKDQLNAQPTISVTRNPNVRGPVASPNSSGPLYHERIHVPITSFSIATDQSDQNHMLTRTKTVLPAESSLGYATSFSSTSSSIDLAACAYRASLKAGAHDTAHSPIELADSFASRPSSSSLSSLSFAYDYSQPPMPAW